MLEAPSLPKDFSKITDAMIYKTVYIDLVIHGE